MSGLSPPPSGNRMVAWHDTNSSMPSKEQAMKYICLGYIEEGKWESLTDDERNAMIDECFTYDDTLRSGGHFVGGEALQGPSNATTLRYRDGKVVVTDGPYAETKEQLGGILILEARDLNHAIQLMSKHPGVKTGPFEIRPAADLGDMVRESMKRRGITDSAWKSIIESGDRAQ
jgi:hypothetical protein